MKGETQIIERLNEALSGARGRQSVLGAFPSLEDWGYAKLAKKERAESIEECTMPTGLARIIFLKGIPICSPWRRCASGRM